MNIRRAIIFFPAITFFLMISIASFATTNQIDVTTYGALGNGTNDDSVAIQNALNVGGTIYFPPGIYHISQNLQILAGTVLTGPGTILGVNVPQVTSTSSNTSFIPALQIYGSIGNPSPITSAIASGTTTIQASNNLSPGDLVMLNNFPTDSGGSDLCSGQNSCSYPSPIGPSTQRQRRRREFLTVLNATSSSITFTTGTLFTYASYDSYRGVQGYAFISKVSPISHVRIDGLTLQGVTIDASYAADVNISLKSALSTAIVGHPCYGCSVSVDNFDAQGTEQRVDFFEGSRYLQIRGSFKNGACPSDCGIVKVNQVADVIIDAAIGPTMQTVSGAFEHGVMIDTDYAEDITGFTDVPDVNVIADITSTTPSTPTDVFVSGDPAYGSPTGITINEKGGTFVYIKGVSRGILTFSGPPSQLRIDGCTNVLISGGILSNLDMNPTNDSGTGANRGNTNISFLNSTFSESNSIPFFNQINGLNLSNVIFDLSQASSPDPNFFPLANFNGVSNLIFNSVQLVSPSSASGLQFWASGNVSNVVAFGGLPAAFPGVTVYGN